MAERCRYMRGKDARVRTRTLPSGLCIATEPIEAVRSCGVGLWVEVGSRYEQAGEEGLSHFIEHMLFKGTRGRDVRQIGDAINYLGGNINAYTTQEVLCLHAKVVDRKAHEALDLLSEMLMESTFPADEIKRERQVVLEEYKMVEDTPDDLSVDIFLRNLWPNHPLGMPVIGTRKSIRTFGRETIKQYWEREFRPDRLMIALAGSFDDKACAQVIKKRFGSWEAKEGGDRAEFVASAVKPRQTYLKRPVEQAYFCLGTAAPHRSSAERFAFGLLNMVLGGGMSSRLFQEIREKRGLAYSIGSFAQLFKDRGCFAVSGGTSFTTFEEVLRITLAEIERICAEEVSEHELAMAREQIVDHMLLGMENTEARMSRIAESMLVFGRVVPVDELIQRIREVTPAEIREVAQRYLKAREFAVSSIGPKEGYLPLRGQLGIRTES